MTPEQIAKVIIEKYESHNWDTNMSGLAFLEIQIAEAITDEREKMILTIETLKQLLSDTIKNIKGEISE